MLRELSQIALSGEGTEHTEQAQGRAASLLFVCVTEWFSEEMAFDEHLTKVTEHQVPLTVGVQPVQRA